MPKSFAKSLLSKYQKGGCNDLEKDLVEDWLTFGNATELDLTTNELDEDLNFIRKRLSVSIPKKASFKYGYTIGIAATIVMVVTLGIYKYKNIQLAPPTALKTQHDVAPGKHGATLTLSNGRKISLTESSSGELAREAGVLISKSVNGQMVYEISASDENNIDLTATNTISTSKGESYILTLPDKSRVWLNAASSITFNTNIGRKAERIVSLIGEAYFEVSHDKSHPFKVVTNNQEVVVLGTHFNVKAYPDEHYVKTTLIQGSVEVNNKLLKPGQQSILTAGKIEINSIDPNTEICWKNNEFVFDGQDFKSVIGSISRWYDVDITYDPAFEHLNLGGQISRNRNLSGIMKMLEDVKGVKYKIEGRRVRIFK